MPFKSPIITPTLFDAVMAQYRLDADGIHGLRHWQRVERFASRIAAEEQIQSDVFSLFALFHDACRRNDGRDPFHGPRGAELVRQFHGTYFNLPLAELDRLCEACEGHTRETHHDDPIISICWDADRLDLTRIGIQPDPALLNRDASRKNCGDRY